MADKKKLAGLPATYTESDEEATSLDITLHDSVMDTDLVLPILYMKDYPVITRSARLVQKGDQKIRLENVMSAAVEFPDMDYEMIHLSGAWARERYVKTRKLEMGTQAVQSLAGTGSSSEQNPFIALKRPHTTEDTGEVFRLQLCVQRQLPCTGRGFHLRDDTSYDGNQSSGLFLGAFQR